MHEHSSRQAWRQITVAEDDDSVKKKHPDYVSLLPSVQFWKADLGYRTTDEGHHNTNDHWPHRHRCHCWILIFFRVGEVVWRVQDGFMVWIARSLEIITIVLAEESQVVGPLQVWLWTTVVVILDPGWLHVKCFTTIGLRFQNQEWAKVGFRVSKWIILPSIGKEGILEDKVVSTGGSLRSRNKNQVTRVRLRKKEGRKKQFNWLMKIR